VLTTSAAGATLFFLVEDLVAPRLGATVASVAAIPPIAGGVVAVGVCLVGPLLLERRLTRRRTTRRRLLALFLGNLAVCGALAFLCSDAIRATFERHFRSDALGVSDVASASSASASASDVIQPSWVSEDSVALNTRTDFAADGALAVLDIVSATFGALDAHGAKRFWIHDTETSAAQSGAPVIGPDGAVTVALWSDPRRQGGSPVVVSYDDTGREKWRFPCDQGATPEHMAEDPPRANDGERTFMSCGASFIAFDTKTGTELWRHTFRPSNEPDDPVTAYFPYGTFASVVPARTLAIVHEFTGVHRKDGASYNDGRLVAFDARTGTVRWEAPDTRAQRWESNSFTLLGDQLSWWTTRMYSNGPGVKEEPELLQAIDVGTGALMWSWKNPAWRTREGLAPAERVRPYGLAGIGAVFDVTWERGRGSGSVAAIDPSSGKERGERLQNGRFSGISRVVGDDGALYSLDRSDEVKPRPEEAPQLLLRMKADGSVRRFMLAGGIFGIQAVRHGQLLGVVSAKRTSTFAREAFAAWSLPSD
jgi:outer membrane protein assembly factor BamB